MPIVLRLNKGSELTFAELDGNFTDLDNRVDTIEGFNLDGRVTRLEQAGTPIYFDSDDVMVILDSIWGGGVDSFLATTDSVGLASFDSDSFLVDSGHVSIRLATYDSAGIASFDSNDFNINSGHITLLNAGTALDSTGVASFDSSDFVVTNGHVTINPASAAGRVAGLTPVDSTGLASFDSADFNVSADGHVTLVGGGGLQAISGGGSLYYPANFTSNIGHGYNGWGSRTFDPWEPNKFPFQNGARYIMNARFYHAFAVGAAPGNGWTGINSYGGSGIVDIDNDAYTIVTLEDVAQYHTPSNATGDLIEFTAGPNTHFKVVAYNFYSGLHNLGTQTSRSAVADNNNFWMLRVG